MADTLKATHTIEYVKPTIRDWTNNEGKKFYFAEVVFENGDEGSVLTMAKPKAEEVQALFHGLKDTPTEFELDTNAKEYNGVKSWKIKGFPGMPSLGGGGGGGGKGGGGMSHTQAGLLAASQVLAGYGIAATDEEVFDRVTTLADALIDWLFTRRGGDSAAVTQPAASGKASGEAVPSPAPPSEMIRLDQRVALNKLASGLGVELDVAVHQAVGKAVGDLSAEEADTLISGWS